MRKGNDILIYEDGAVIAGTRDFTLNEQMDVIENSSPSSSSARTYEADKSSMDVTVTRLITSMNGAVLHQGSTYSLKFCPRHDATDYQTGTFLCIDAQVDATVGNLARGTWKFISVDGVTSTSLGDYNSDFNNDFLIS